MDWDWLTLDGVDWLAVVLATLAAFAVGATWYAKALFGAAWMKIVGITEDQAKNAVGMPLNYSLTMLTAFVSALVLNIAMVWVAIADPIEGAVFGALVGLVFRLGGHVIHNGFAGRGHKLTLIDGGHDVVSLAAAGAIIGAFL